MPFTWIVTLGTATRRNHPDVAQKEVYIKGPFVIEQDYEYEKWGR